MKFKYAISYNPWNKHMKIEILSLFEEVMTQEDLIT